MKARIASVCVVVCLWAVSVPAYGQGVGASGDIKGTASDASGAVLPKVKVTVAETEKGLRRSVMTDEKGQYRVTGLLPATYDVSAELSGFQSEVRKGVVVTVGQTVVVDFQVNVSAVTTTIEVMGQPPLVETEKGHQADTVQERYIHELPIDRRDYLTYTLLMPGVTDSRTLTDNSDFRVKQTPQSGLSFYGSNGRGNSVTVDGGEANDDGGAVRLTLSQDAVQEFQINRSNYSAELGSASGASINIVSKSGTNEVHGSAYGFFRNDALDARDPFAIDSALKPGDPFSLSAKGKPITPPLNRQQFGGTVGFPVHRDKTFLFFAYEGLNRNESAPVPLLTDTSIFAPTAAQEAKLATLPPGQAACLRSVLTIDPTRAAPGGCPAKSFPATVTEPFIDKLFRTNSGVFPFKARSDLVSGRLDHQFNANNQLFMRYNFGRDNEQNPNLQALVGFSRGNLVKGLDSTIALGWYRQFSALTQNEARVQWNYYTFDVTPNDPGGPELNLPGFAFLDRDIFLPSFTTARRYEFADNVTFIRGGHKMKFGGNVLLRGNRSESHTFFPGRFNFGELPGGLVSPALDSTTITSLQAFKLGLPQFYQQGFGDPTVKSLNPFVAVYWQDSWSPWSNLTLNFGLRYELDKRYAPLHTDTDNFAPRFSFAWDPFRDHKTVVRGGYGIFYSPIYYQIDYVVRALGVVDGSGNQVRDLSGCASGSVTCIRQIGQVFVPFNPTGFGSQNIFRTLLAQGKIACGSPTGEACITLADLAQFKDAEGKPLFGITHTGPVPARSVVFSGSPDYQNPYSQQAEFGIERAVTPNLSISANYIFVRTLKVTRARDKNLLPAPIVNGIRQWGGTSCPGGAVNPATRLPTCFVNFLLSQDNVYESSGRAFYHGFILSVNKRFSQHLSFFGNYTLSKAIDEVTDYNSDFQANDQTNLRAERALSAFDQRHKVVIGGILESPWKGGASASTAARIFSGFTLSPIVRGNSGRPFNLLAGTDVNGDRHSTTDRPPGAGRNTGLGPDFWTFDMRLTKRLNLGEKVKLELMAEAFNLFNRLNFSSINNTVGVIAPPFNLSGRRDLGPSRPLGFTSAFPRRQLQLGLRFNF